MVVSHLFIPIRFALLKTFCYHTSQSTTQFAAIVYDLWVDFLFSVNFPLVKDESSLTKSVFNTHTHTVEIFLEEKWFYFRFIFYLFLSKIALLEIYVCIYF